MVSVYVCEVRCMLARLTLPRPQSKFLCSVVLDVFYSLLLIISGLLPSVKFAKPVSISNFYVCYCQD